MVSDVESYGRNLSIDGKAQGLWFDHLIYRDALRQASPFPALAPLASFLPTGVSVSATSLERREFYLDSTNNCWHLNDRLLVGLHKAARGEAELKQLISLFLFHEYLHLFHSLSKRTAEEVGKFSNCLEHIDYTADAYALIHQLDFYRTKLPDLLDEKGAIRFLFEQTDLVLRSFWAFDEETGSEWQVRRIRRYLNWYWRLAQLQRATRIGVAMSLFAAKPYVELCGMQQVSRGRRTFAKLDKLDRATHLEMAIVMENEKLYRITEGPNTRLYDLLCQFLHGGHEEIKSIFNAVFDIAEGQGSAVLPDPRITSFRALVKT